ncbi:PREDICTED: phosphatidate phosphatase LPIN2 isoform X2 [Trachymyrmex septentrionalis]|uniref:phosphatidate phosphatase LPIN2 isoform X2 n=1 Tax=Trachymyrmex septentrionalis TaxID=34720 RepID=UPI00084F3DF5|nr:PREDICTED: phosphatidate phosphatase LPIN2 isoform X2 [Trachymyrmex septentrionalis]
MYSMNYIAKIISNFRLFYNEINAATLTGAIDVIVIEQPDSSFTCSPFHVRFGKLGVLRSRAKVVDIEINGEPREIHMKLGDSGEAFFVEEVSSNGSPTDTEIPPHLACSPIPDNCFPPPKFNLLSDLPQEQREKILIDSVLSIEREKWEQMSALPPDQREKFLIEQFSDLPAEHREKWLQIASLTAEERDEMFKESFGIISPEQKQQMIREQYSALKTEDKERLFKENFPELSIEQRQNFEKALLSDWKEKEEKWEEKHDKNDDEEIFDMDAISDEQPKSISCPKSFVAVTSSERIRKISVVKNDFRPITDDHQNINKEKSSDESNSSLGKKNLKEENVDETKSNNSTKRKRKRKSIMKKKGSQRKTSNGNTSQTELSETDAIFTEESISETGPPPMTEEETNTVPESATSSQDIIEKRPETDFHFFSDSEVTKNKDSRPCSPVQSDTEFEVRKITQDGSEREDDKGHQQSWRWGELPSPPPEPAHMSHRNSLNSLATASQPNKDAQRSMLSGMFSFMKKTSRVRHNPESEGIYLSDLNADELDPEVAALYFPSSHRGPTMVKDGKTVDEEDTESGNGPSLPQSPNSVEGAIGGPKSLDSDFEEPKHSIFDNSIEISLSLCGGLDSENGPSKEAFNENLLHFEDVCTDPKLYENPNLVVKINGKFYNWTTACRIVLTYVVFQRHLPQSVIENLYMSLPVHEDKKRQSSDKSESRSGYSSWFSWRRSTQPSKKPQDTSQNDEIAVQIPDQSVEVKTVTNDELSSANREIKTEQNTDSSSSTEIMEIISCTRLPTASNETTLTETEKTREGEGEGYSGGEDSDSNHNEPTGVKIPVERRPYYESTEKYRKTLRLSSEQIASLDLKDGANEVVFSVTTAYQGTKRCKCHIYKWKWDDKIVISDIDGTITKSDVLGHILPIVGKDWAQSGVAQLFTKIKNNGYKLLYLSARAIGQAGGTREYLRNLRQGDLTLPEGPLLLNPTSLILAFHREVIEKKPEEFKISCLKDIQALFPEGSEPFYAGYGNRINDVWAYRAVGIPIMRIFTINHRGELKHELTQTFQSSYSNMSFIVDQVFPARREDATDEFSNFAYWRDPIPEVPKLEELYTQALII